MTPAQLDHLNRIKTHLETLLANAEKRTPGEWRKASEPQASSDGRIHVSYNPDDAIFIASCAVNAEAGWRSTKAAIDTIHIMQRNRGDQGLVTETLDAVTEALTTQILAAWPLELITKHQ